MRWSAIEVAVDPVLQLPGRGRFISGEQLHHPRIRLESGENIIEHQLVLGMGERTVRLRQGSATGVAAASAIPPALGVGATRRSPAKHRPNAGSAATITVELAVIAKSA